MNKHGNCDFHKYASEILATTVDVSEMLSKQATTEREKSIVIAKSLLFHFSYNFSSFFRMILRIKVHY